MSASNQIMFLNILYPEFLQKVAAHWFLNNTIGIKKKKREDSRYQEVYS